MDIPQEKKKKDPKYNNTPEYNKKYYAKRREDILNTLKTKCICDLCGRKVNYQRMNQHKTTKLCFNNQKSVINDLAQQVEKLSQEINELKSN